MFRKLFTLLMVGVFSLFAVVPAFAQAPSDGQSGAVYVMTNNPAGNQIVEYLRAADGTLSSAGTFDTGGLGSGVGVSSPPDPLGSQNALVLSPDQRYLFAVNAGSNTVSAFRIKGDQLILTDQESSHGEYPVSLAVHNNILYVLNAGGNGSISGFRTADGHLVPIRRSTRSLHANTPADGSQPNINELPGQVGFSPNGRYLVVTDKGGVSGQGKILVFTIARNALPVGKPAVTDTATPVPFSFSFDSSGHLVVVDPGATSATSYMLGHGGALSEINSVVTGQAATCWIGSNGSYLFTDNTGASTVSALQSDGGSLSLLDATAASTGAGTLPLDLAITPDGQFLYTLQTGSGEVGAFQINADGSLTALGAVGGLPALGGAQGIAAR